MTSAALVDGVKISKISLLNPPKRMPGKDFQFHIEIQLDGNKENRKKIGKENLDEDDRVVWNEPISFAGNVIDSVLTFHVIKTRWSHISYSVGLCQEKVADLLEMQSHDGSCKLKIGATTGQLSFNIERQSESSLLSDAVSGAEDASSRIPTMEHLGNISNVTSSVHDTVVNQEDTWSSFLSQFSVFMAAMDQIAEIHPYAKMAWSVLSVIPKTIIAEKNRNDSVKQLVEELRETYDFITDVERLSKLRDTQVAVFSKLVQQTIECAYFIQEYSRTSISKKIWKGGDMDNQVKTFSDVFNHLKRVMTDSVALETNIATLRVAVTVTEIHELELLKEVPYEPRAGLIPGKRCLPGTRENLIQGIIDWVNHDTPERIFVLSGAAGTGKSAVAHTIAGKFQEQNRLGSLFCFSRSYKEMRNSLFSTISRDIADGDVSWQKGLIRNIQKKAIRSSTDPGTQFQELIVQPSMVTSTIGPVVIVIDALDESGDPTERQSLLDILFGRLSELPINYRIILTTRPEQDIELYCQGPNVLCKRMADIAEKETLLDIQNYISHRLKPIAGLLDNIQSGWSGVLAKRTEGLFQWAETACLTMDGLRHPPLVKQAWDACTSGPSTSLYELYHNIISIQRECQYPEFMDGFKLIIGAIMTAREPLTVDALSNIFQGVHVKTILSPFGSLLIGVHHELTPIRPLHSSLLDFFHAPNRNATAENKYYVDTSDQSTFTLGCLQLMNQTLHFNMCDLKTSHLRNRGVRGFAKRVKEAIPLHLSYTCRFWGFHLRNSGERKNCILAQLRILMQDKLLYWFEVLGLLKEVEKGQVAMRILRIWCQDTDIELADQAADSWQFGFDFGYVIETSTPHLYISALPFTPRDSFISKRFSPMYPRLFNIEGEQQIDSLPKTGLVKKNSSSVASSLAFSPQGKYIATGFENGGFWFWDRESGEILYQRVPKKKNTWNSIGDIVFSPDGQLVYCCFLDGHIRIWNIKTNETVDDPHQDIMKDGCEGCTVSSDGHYIIFIFPPNAWHESALLLCDRTSRQKLMQFDDAHSVVFTPKGDLLAFWNQSACVWLWDICRQTLVHSWPRGDSSASALALSDRQIAFSQDDSIQVWDIHTLTMICKIQTTFKYYDICFAGDRHLLSYSYNIYTIWDIPTGQVVVKSSLGDRILNFAASFDAKYVALSADDNTIYVGPLDTPYQWKKPDTMDTRRPFEAWMRGRHLVQVCKGRHSKYDLLVSDVMTLNNIVFQAQCSEMLVAVSPRNEHIYVAYITTHGLCLWNDVDGEFTLNKSTGIDIDFLEYSPLGDRLISAGLSGLKIWDVDTRTLIGGPYIVPGEVSILTFSETGDYLVVAYNQGEQATFIEVRDSQSRHVLRGPFKSADSGSEESSVWDVTLKLSANETKIIWMTESGIEILDAMTGERELFRPFIHTEYTPMRQLRQLSPDRKYIAWRVDSNKLELWDISTGNKVLHQLLPTALLEGFLFSDDSTQIAVLYSVNHRYYIDLRDVSTGGTVGKEIQIYAQYCDILSLNGNNLIISNGRIPTILNLDIHLIMSSLYQHHKDHSKFGKFPVIDSEARREIHTLTCKLTSWDQNMLEYALMAWEKALFCMYAAIGEDGWILGPHGELLVWIPNKRRSTLWRPCMTHIGAKHITKLNLDQFVHGVRWIKCKGDL